MNKRSASYTVPVARTRFLGHDARMHVEVRQAIDRLMEREHLSGIDPFGFRPEILEQVLPVSREVYRRWFRAETFNIDRVPPKRVLLIANHSGQLPFDAAMIATAMLLDHDPPRALRTMIEHFVPTIPFVSTFLTRAGQVVGTRQNARRLLHEENCVLVFPEGSRGISKPYAKKYQLERFGLGFMRLALETQTPIVPIAVVGAEEQLPTLFNLKPLARMLNVDRVGVAPNLFIPLPVKYRIYFGEPMTFSGDPDDADKVINSKVREVTREIARMIEQGLAERDGYFR